MRPAKSFIPNNEKEPEIINIYRIVGKGDTQSAVSVVVPSIEQIKGLTKGEPVLVILGILKSEQEVGADRILPVALQRIYELFCEDKEKSILKRLKKIAESIQHILADLFFKEGVIKGPFNVVLDLATISLVRDVYYLYVDGKIRVWIIRGNRVVEISKVYASGGERFKGSGRWVNGDKLVLASAYTKEVDWIIDQLRDNKITPVSIEKSVTNFGPDEGVLLLCFGEEEHGNFEEIEKEKISSVEKVEKGVENKVAFLPEEGEKKEVLKDDVEQEKIVSSLELEEIGGMAESKTNLLIKEIMLKAKSVLKGVLNPFWGKIDILKRKKFKNEKEDKESIDKATSYPVWRKRRKTTLFLKDWTQSVGFFISNIFGFLTRFKKRRQIVKSGLTEKKQMVKGFVGILVILFLCFVIGFLINKSFKEKSAVENYRKQEEAIDAEVRWLEEHKSDASITVDDRLSRVDGVRASIASLKNNPHANQQKINDFILRLQNVEDFLTKTIPISQIDVLADFAIQYSSANPVDIDVRGSEVFVLDAASKKVYTVNLLTHEVNIFAECNECNNLEKIAWSENHLFVYDSKKGLFEVSEGGSFKAVSGLSPFGATVAELSTYMDNIYFLLPDSRSIIKSVPVKDGYSVGQQYNKAALPVGCEDMTINGFIFVCTANGDVKKFERGEEKPFVLSGLRNRIGTRCLVDTYIPKEEEENYIYILDSDNKRIVVVDKDASDGNAFITQLVYRGDPMWFKNIKEISLTDDKRGIIILDGSAILRIDITYVYEVSFR